jgi:hypothetical protein
MTDDTHEINQQLQSGVGNRFAQIESTTASIPIVDELMYELGVQQIELEIQNEELRQTIVDLETSRRYYLDLYEFAPVTYLTQKE